MQAKALLPVHREFRVLVVSDPLHMRRSITMARDLRPGAERGVTALPQWTRRTRQIGPLRERTRRIRADLRRAFDVDYLSLEWLHRAWKIPQRDWMREVDAFL